MAKFTNNIMQRYEGMSARMGAKLDTLSPRDRFALIILTVFLGCTAIILALWSSHQAAQTQQNRLIELKDSITWMQTHAVQFSQQADDGTSVEKAQRLAQQTGLTIQVQNQQDQVQLITSHQNYAVLANYMTQLTQQGVSITAMNMQKQPEGAIELKMTLR